MDERGLRTLYWLDDLGGVPIVEADEESEGFLFAGARSFQDYSELVGKRPGIRDRPEARRPLLELDRALCEMQRANLSVPQPKTWVLGLDQPVPEDLTFPLFLRTPNSSWKLGGKISRVSNPDELEAEAAELRRAFGWDSSILAREWLELDVAGESMYGPVPQEVRTWIVDARPYAWSFHHLHIVGKPKGFPFPQQLERELHELSSSVGSVFTSRLAVADFARRQDSWVLIEVGPGSAAGTAHEDVFKSVARFLDTGDVTTVKGPYGSTFECVS